MPLRARALPQSYRHVKRREVAAAQKVGEVRGGQVKFAVGDLHAGSLSSDCLEPLKLRGYEVNIDEPSHLRTLVEGRDTR